MKLASPLLRVLVFISVSLVACRSQGPGMTLQVDRAERRIAQEFWKAHEDYLRAVLTPPDLPREIDQDRFTRAVEFFEELTGIKSDTGTYLGRIPTSRLHVSLKEWRQWYKLHKDELRFDFSTCRVLNVHVTS